MKMKDRKSEIINKDIPLMNFNSILTTKFAKITPSLDIALNKCEEEFEEMLEELNVKEDDTVEDVHDISKRVIFEALDTFQAYATLVTYISSQRGDFDEIMEQWKRKQRQRIRQYLGDEIFQVQEKEIKNVKVGDVFIFKGKKYKAKLIKPEHYCQGCAFEKEDCDNLVDKELIPACGHLGCIFIEIKNQEIKK